MPKELAFFNKTHEIWLGRVAMYVAELLIVAIACLLVTLILVWYSGLVLSQDWFFGIGGCGGREGQRPILVHARLLWQLPAGVALLSWE